MKRPNHNKHRGTISELIGCKYLLEIGYEVFRNVSQHGLADVAAISPSGELVIFDIKTASVPTWINSKGKTMKGNPIIKSLSSEQEALGIKALYVLEDGSVKISS